jgi:hypothetical protein
MLSHPCEYLENFEMWYWSKMEESSWNFLMKKRRSVTWSRGKGALHTIQRRKANWICHILHKSCCLNILLKEWDGKTRKKTLETNEWLYGKEKVLELEYVVNSLWKRLRACRKTDYE